MNPQKLIAPAIISALLFAALAQPASAGLILTDSWSIGSYIQASGSKPTFTTNAVGNSNLGGVTAHPITNPFTQTLTLNTPTTNEILFVAVPPGSGAAAIPVNFTLSDTTGGTASFTYYINYFADQFSDWDDMVWSTTAPSTSALVKITSAPSLVQTVTLSDLERVQITLPYEKDWNMAQEVTFQYLGKSGGGGGQSVPEPGSLLLLVTALAGLGVLGRRGRKRQLG